MKKLLIWTLLVILLTTLFSGCTPAEEMDRESEQVQEIGLEEQECVLRELEYLPDTSLKEAMNFSTIVFYNGYMYYFDDLGDYSFNALKYLHRARIDGSENVILCEMNNYINNIAVCDEWIFVAVDGGIIRISQQYDEMTTIYKADSMEMWVFVVEDRLYVSEIAPTYSKMQILSIDGEELIDLSDQDLYGSAVDGTYIYSVPSHYYGSDLYLSRMDRNGEITPFVETEQCIGTITYGDGWLYYTLQDENYDIEFIERCSTTTKERQSLFNVKNLDGGQVRMQHILHVVEDKIYYAGRGDEPYFSLYRCDHNGENNENFIPAYGEFGNMN